MIQERKKKDIKFLKGQNDSSSLNIFQNNTLLPVYCSKVNSHINASLTASIS